MNKQQLASRIWASANKMRSKIEASEYKDYILGFIFYKFLSEKEVSYLLADEWTENDLKDLSENDSDTVKYVQNNIGYFISFDNLFSTWLARKSAFDVSDVTTALSAFDALIAPAYQKVFKDVFKTLQTGLDKLGENSGARTKAIRGLIDLIKDIPMDGKQDYDVLGFIYEYLISNFAANAGKKAGEFYTPHEVSTLMSQIVSWHLRDRSEIEIYDPTSGSGSLLINIGRAAGQRMDNSDHIKYYAQELKEATYNLTRMNLVMRGILPSNIITRCGDTLDKDWPFFDENNAYAPLYVDAVVSNPPYSQNWDPDSHKGDVRFDNYGYAPKSKADYAFLLHDLYHVKPNGIMNIVLPHGVLFRGGEEEKIRTRLIENDHIETIIGLPANIFFGTGIPTIIMVLKQKRDASDVLFIDASKHFLKEGKNNKLQASDIHRIMDAVIERKNDPKFEGFSRLVSKEEIRANGYNLNIPRYVDSSEREEPYDIYAMMFGGIPNSEIQNLGSCLALFPSLKAQLFKPDADKPYSELISKDVAETIRNNAECASFLESFKKAFSDFPDFLRSNLIDGIGNIQIYKAEDAIAEGIFNRLSAFPIVDKYKAYQILDDCYKIIAQDLEIIQTEGITALNVVDPKMVIKKKDGKEVEVQEGWLGHILPFDLVQKECQGEELKAIADLEEELSDISSQYEELLGNLSEEDKDRPFISEDGDSFVPKEVKEFAKPLRKSEEKYESDSLERILLSVDDLIEKEKGLKKSLKDKQSKLGAETKSLIEGLDKAFGLSLLEKKLFCPIMDGILSLPETLLTELTKNVATLADKYSTTLVQLSKDIVDSEASLSSMLDELKGDPFDEEGLKEFKKLLKGGNHD
jgi:type I restriction system adenine methylase (hsdM)